MSVHINSKTYPAEYLSKSEDIQRGMMGRDTLNGCMVFKMGLGHHSFWMKNCLIKLDIVFVQNKRITHIYLNCPVEDSHRMNPPHYNGIGDHVIEFPGGTANEWKIGDKVFIGE